MVIKFCRRLLYAFIGYMVNHSISQRRVAKATRLCAVLCQDPHIINGLNMAAVRPKAW